MPNLPTRHAALLALLDGMAQIEQAAPTTPDSLARLLHSIYEIEAARVGWLTQASCQVPFDELPAANKRVMIGTAEAILAVLPVAAFPPLLAYLRAEAERCAEHATVYDHIIDSYPVGDMDRINAEAEQGDYAAAHTRICRAVLDAAGDTPEAARLKEVMDAG